MNTKVRVSDFGIIANNKIVSYHHSNSEKIGFGLCLDVTKLVTKTKTIIPPASAPPNGTINLIPSSSSSSTVIPLINGTSTTAIKQVPIGSGGHSIIPSDILDDLASRFIINVPDDERNNLIRICFQIELAHWFYLDFFCSIEDKKLMPCGMKQFAMLLFQHIPFLRAHLSTIDKILEDWKEYKLSVPTYGAILISEDLKHVLLVQSYWAKSSWGFPKGKVNEHEDPVHCAAREVYEETGYDISELIVPNDYIEAVINYQYTRLYLVRNVPLETIFSPRTRKEIKCIEWFPVDSLPINKNDVISKQNLGINANSFFMIMPFIKRLKKWVQDNRCIGGINIKPLVTAVAAGTATTTSSSSPVLSTGITAIAATATTTTTAATVAATSTPGTGITSSIVCYNGGNGGSSSNSTNNQNGYSSSSSSSSSTTTNSVTGIRKKDSKLSQNNLVNDISALNISKNSCKQNNNNNNNFPCCKRQRHKSMGDIDGIKVNFNVYNTNCYYNGNNLTNTNNSKYYNGTKYNVTQINSNQLMMSVTAPTASSASTSATTNTTATISDPSSVSSSLVSSNMTTTSSSSSSSNNKREKYNKTNFNKRQNSTNNSNCNNNNYGTGNNNNNNLSNMTNNNTNNLINSNNKNSNCSNNNNGTKNSNILLNNNSNNVRSQSIQHQHQQQQPSKKQQQQKNHFTVESNNNKTNIKLDNHNSNKDKQQQLLQKSQKGSEKFNFHNIVKIPPTTATNTKTSTLQKCNIDSNDDEIKKLSPNFDSWTSFTFTKNFISNVFC